MNIKEKIGLRIRDLRKEKNLTQVELAQLAGGLRQSRINNWERGIRTPGLEEVKELAKILEVPPAYIMCLTDRKYPHPLDKNHVGALVPLLNEKQASDPEFWISALSNPEFDGDMSFVPIDIEIAPTIGKNTFAIKVTDDSMEPELKINDVLIVDPSKEPSPGGIVVAQLENNKSIVIRRYKQSSAFNKNEEFDLLVANNTWASAHIDKSNKGRVVGVVVSYFRKLAS